MAFASDVFEMRQGEDGKPRIQVISGTIGAVLAGLLPVVLSLVGIWGFAERGYLLNREGQRIWAGWPTWAGLAGYVILIVGGVVLIRWGVSYYCRHSSSEEPKREPSG